jgi:Ribosomal protein S19e
VCVCVVHMCVYASGNGLAAVLASCVLSSSSLCFTAGVFLGLLQMSKRAPATVKDVPADVFIKEYAAHLKRCGRIRLPKWVDLVKTAHFKELSPYDQVCTCFFSPVATLSF